MNSQDITFGTILDSRLTATGVLQGSHSYYSTRITWSRVLLEKLIVTQLVKKFLALHEPEGSLACSHEPATGTYPEPDALSPHLPALSV